MSSVITDIQGVGVVDGEFSDDELVAYRSCAEFLAYSSPHKDHWSKSYGRIDGNVMQSELLLRGARDKTPPGMDILGDAVERVFSIGRGLGMWPSGAEGYVYSGRVVLIGSGTGIDWHRDGTHLLGAFNLYLHPSWDTRWGGELQVVAATKDEGPASGGDGVASGSPTADRGPFLVDTKDDERRMTTGVATTLFPKPGRIVYVDNSTEHRVTAVTPEAGSNFRCALTGFVLSTAS